MPVHESSDRKSGFEFRKTDFSSANGSKTFGFSWKARSRGFSAEIDNIWFYGDDILDFLSKLKALLSQEQTKAELNAMSDLNIIVEKLDDLGHFSVHISLKDQMYGNSAQIVAELEAQGVSQLIRDLEQIIRNQ